MTDSVSEEKRSKIMSRIKGSDTSFEDSFRKKLWRRGLRYRKNVKSMIGKPDLYFPRDKIVVFLDSCFWHGCEYHCRMPKSNIEYWEGKIGRNKKRDAEITKYYSNNGYKIMRFWEHEINENLDYILDKIERAIKGKS